MTEKQKTPNYFAVENSLTETKENLIASGKISEEEYYPRKVNKTLSWFPDCIPFVDVMNQFPLLPEKMQYDFYFFALMKKYRQKNKWAKMDQDRYDTIRAVAWRYRLSLNEAENVLRLIDHEVLMKVLEAYRVMKDEE